MEVNGWQLFAHPLFSEQLERLTKRVEDLAVRDPKGYRSHPASKLLFTIRRYILQLIPQNPNAGEFRQGNTLGPDNRHWFRAKFHQRYRLFYRFSTRERIIIYTWVNDQSTLRKSGSKSDVYEQFKAMLQSGEPPSSFQELLNRSHRLRTN